jgi:hypothetical protein
MNPTFCKSADRCCRTREKKGARGKKNRINESAASVRQQCALEALLLPSESLNRALIALKEPE